MTKALEQFDSLVAPFFERIFRLDNRPSSVFDAVQALSNDEVITRQLYLAQQLNNINYELSSETIQDLRLRISAIPERLTMSQSFETIRRWEGNTFTYSDLVWLAFLVKMSGIPDVEFSRLYLHLVLNNDANINSLSDELAYDNDDEKHFAWTIVTSTAQAVLDRVKKYE